MLKSKPVRKEKARAVGFLVKNNIKCIYCWNRYVCSPFPSCPPKIIKCIGLRITAWICTLSKAVNVAARLKTVLQRKLWKEKKNDLFKTHISFLYSWTFYNFHCFHFSVLSPDSSKPAETSPRSAGEDKAKAMHQAKKRERLQVALRVIKLCHLLTKQSLPEAQDKWKDLAMDFGSIWRTAKSMEQPAAGLGTAR